MTPAEVDVLEREAVTRLEALIHHMNADTARFREESDRLRAKLQSTTSIHRATLASFREWIDRLRPFEAVSRHLQAAGRSAFTARLEATRNDWASAAEILSNMVQAGQAADRKIGSIMAESRAGAFDAVERMAAETRKAYDEANAAWLAGLQQ